MVDLYNMELIQLSVHKTSPEPDEVIFTEEPVFISDNDLKEDFTALMMKNFLTDAPYRFAEKEIAISENSYSTVKSMFENPSQFHDNSVEMTRIYLENSFDGSIKSGELIFCQLENIIFEGESVKGVAIVKVENKEKFLELKADRKSYAVSLKQGFALNKQNKAVLILNVEPEKGFVLFFRKTDLGLTRNYFMDEFLKVNPVTNSFYHTANHMNLLKTYLENEMVEEDKIEKIDKLNRSVEFMKNNEKVNMKEFESDIFEKPEHIEAFENFRKNYAQDHELDIVDEFEVSAPAINRSKRYIRSVLKLDKNFHVYVHGNRQNIVRGYDPDRKMNYYTLYFNDES